MKKTAAPTKARKENKPIPPFTLNVRAVANGRGITSSYQLQKALGLNSPSHAVRLYENNAVSISFKTLALLCDKLACTPNELLVMKPSPRRQRPR